MQAISAGLHGLLFAFCALIIGILIGAAFNRVLLRFPRILAGRLKALPKALKIFGRRSGAGGLSAHPGSTGELTAIQRELFVTDAAPKGGEPKREAEAFTRDRAEAALVRRIEFDYSRFQKPSSEYDDLPDTFTDELADRYARFARVFLSNGVALTTDHNNLYEDEEGAVIIRMFRRSDRPIFFAIDRFRRVVGDNARRVTAHFVVATAIPLIAAALLSALQLGQNPAAIVCAGIATVLGWVIALFSYVTYTKARDSGFDAFSGLLERYLAGVSDKFFHANTRMSQVILGEEDDHDRLAENAEKWHKIMLWLGLRTFFIESFLRGAVYQARRNLGFYGVGAFLLLVLVPGFVALSHILAALEAASWNFGTAASALSGDFAGAFYAVAFASGLICHLILRRKDADLALSQKDWRGFGALHMEEKMREVIGKYAQEAAIGKRRGVVRSGGGH